MRSFQPRVLIDFHPTFDPCFEGTDQVLPFQKDESKRIFFHPSTDSEKKYVVFWDISFANSDMTRGTRIYAKMKKREKEKERRKTVTKGSR